jgi:hypothetical protein
MEQSLLVPIPEACRLLGGISRAKLYELLRTGWRDAAGNYHRLESRHVGVRRFITRRSIERIAFGDEADVDRGAA